MDTIFAPASGRVRAGVSVIRISGPLSYAVLETLTGMPAPEPRRLVLRSLRDSDGEVLDTGLVVCFSAGASFTGEESAELHVHGSIAVVNAVLRRLSGMPGLRLAVAGEFTRRALENGRLDLAQVEGLADLVAAETEAQRRQAQRLAAGGLRENVAAWRISLVRALALLEACIDFPDEDIPDGVLEQVRVLIADLLGSLGRELDGYGIAERIREGFEVAIVGPPNVGKSTLLNALAGREAAITSEIAGTTRDVIEVRMDLDGLPVTLLDTAGLRSSEDPVEATGVARALQRAEGADVRVILLGHPGEVPLIEPKEGDLVVLGRADLFPGAGVRAVSGLTGLGIENMIREVSVVLAGRAAGAGGISRARHRDVLERAHQSLAFAEDQLNRGEVGVELVAESLREVMRGIERLVGRVDVEDVLDELFGAFCIGK